MTEKKELRIERRKQMIIGAGKYEKNINTKKAYENYKINHDASGIFYQSEDWKKIKEWVFKRYKYKCTCCGSKENLHVDHIIPISINPELCLVFDNLQYLCHDCNSLKSNLTSKKFSRFTRLGKEKSFMPNNQELAEISSRWILYFPKK